MTLLEKEEDFKVSAIDDVYFENLVHVFNEIGIFVVNDTIKKEILQKCVDNLQI